ncbi:MULTISPECIES: ion channel [Halobacterium]|uniref:ion channel n=1 Tax=Halobacterium TaxID=2239 RepID=UPI00073E272B|nr:MULTISPECIES: ion channel [Halobacterium]MCG1003690.1 ion channel [Halobacterium noricense]
MDEAELQSIVQAAEQNPASAVEALDELADALDAETAAERNLAVRAYSRLASEYPERVGEHASALLDRVEDPNNVVRYNALLGFQHLADAGHPAPALDALDRIAARVDPGEEQYDEAREAVLNLLNKLAVHDPDRVAEYAPALASRLERGTPHAKYYAARAAADLPPEDAPDSLLDALVAVARDGGQRASGAAVTALERVAEADPERVREAISDAYPSVDATSDVDDLIGELTGTTGANAVNDFVDAINEVLEHLRDFEGQDPPLDDPPLGDEAADQLRRTFDDATDTPLPAQLATEARRIVDVLNGRLNAETHGWSHPEPVDERDGDECRYACDHPDVDGRWNCDRSTHGESEYCIFHASVTEKSHSDVREALLGELNESDNTPRFVGSRFERLDLSYLTLDTASQRPLDFRGVHVLGQCNFTQTRFEHAVSFADATLFGADFSHADFGSTANFDGASAVSFTFDGATFDDTVTLTDAFAFTAASFRDVLARNRVEFSDADLLCAVDFYDATIRGKLLASDATFYDHAEFSGLTLDDSGLFTDAEFYEDVEFFNVTTEGSLLYQNATFHEDADFDAADFGDTLSFFGCTFHGDVDVSSSRVEGVFNLGDASVAGELNCYDISVDDAVHAPDATFEGEVTFEQSTVRGMSVMATEFRGPLTFEAADLLGECVLLRCTVTGETSFYGSTCRDGLLLDKSTFESYVDIRQASIASLSALDTSTTGDSGYFDAVGATVDDGDIRLPRSNTPAFDFTEATLGTVRIWTEAPSVTVLDHVKLMNTSYEGFDFGPFKDELTANQWRIHETAVDLQRPETEPADRVAELRELFGALTEDKPINYREDILESLLDELNVPVEAVESLVADDSEDLSAETVEELAEAGMGPLIDPETPTESPREETPSILENTYLKARNAAAGAGDLTARRGFFINEMRYRRRRHGEAAVDGDGGLFERGRAAGRWAGNWLMGATTGYGHKLSRVGVASAAVVTLWAVFYTALSGISGGNQLNTPGVSKWSALATPEGASVFVENLYFSVVTFSTLGFGGVRPVGTAARLLAAGEAMLGALLTALLVFVLGRRVAG